MNAWPDDSFPAPSDSDRNATWVVSLKFALGYTIVGLIWILCSDYFLYDLLSNVTIYFQISLLKGLAFVIGSGLLLWLVLYFYIRKTRQVEDQLRERERELRSFLGNLPGMAYRTGGNLERSMEFVSGQCELITGYKPETIVENGDMTFSSIIHPEDRQNVSDKIQDAVDRRQSFSVNYRIHDGSDDIKWVKDRGRGVYEDGELIAIEGILQDITDVKQAEKEARQARVDAEFKKRHDGLTGLKNRRWFLRTMDDIIGHLDDDSDDTRYGFCIVDLDNFRKVNDFYGHWVGNELLRRSGQWLEDCLSEEDLIGRLGGDEFGVLIQLPDNGCTPQEALQNRLSSFQVSFSLEDVEITQSFSVGMSVVPDDGTTLEDVIAAANRALNRIKDKVEQSIGLFEESDRKILEAKVSASEQILEALDDYRLQVYYQPIVDVRTGEIILQEALLRVFDENGSMMTLGDFKEVIYDGRVTSKLDRWIIQTIFKETKQIIGSDNMPLVSFNLFPPTTVNLSFFKEITSWIDEMGYPKERLVVEISEKLLLSHRENATQNIKEIAREEDIKFALDDFGVGHGSFKTLKELPIDFLKIDGSFIHDLPAKNVNQNFVDTITDLCDEIDMDVIGEWVEDEQTCRLLESLGVYYQQGFYFHEAKPLDEWIE